MAAQDKTELDELLDLLYRFIFPPRERRNSALHLLKKIGELPTKRDEQNFRLYLEQMVCLPDALHLPKLDLNDYSKQLPSSPPEEPPTPIIKKRVKEMHIRGGNPLTKAQFLLRSLQRAREKRERAQTERLRFQRAHAKSGLSDEDVAEAFTTGGDGRRHS